MKATAEKLHLLDSDDPVLMFVGRVARCGFTFHRAEIRWMFSGELKPNSRNLDDQEYARGLCKACQFLEPVGSEKRRYLYGLSEGRQNFAAIRREESA